MKRSFVLALAVIAPLSSGIVASAQTAPKTLPKADTILEQYVEATGGRAAYEKVKSTVATGEVEIPAANLKGKLEIFEAAPNRMAVVIELGPIGKTVQGTDGKTVWENSPINGERELDGPEKEAFLLQAAFNKELRWKELYASVECTDLVDVDGKPAYKVVLTPKSGNPSIEYYDKTSHLQVKGTATTKGPMGEISVDVYPSDYKKVNGILMPMTVTQKVLGQELVMRITDVKHNVDIPASTFSPPASLKEPEAKKAK
jgi:outer membrane lipoprotein-sorting protein